MSTPAFWRKPSRTRRRNHDHFQQRDELQSPKTKKERTVEIQRSLETRARFPISYFDSRKYTQHNVLIEDGLGPILAFMASLPANRTKVDVLCSFEDGDYSVAHANYELGDWGRMVGFEVHRWENDRIVEHWDNLQAVATPNPSGRTMTDGAPAVIDIDRTDANKALVDQYTTPVYNGGARRGQSRRNPILFHGDALIQRNPQIGDGVAALVATLASGRAICDRLHKLLGEGNLVLAISEGTTGGADGVRQPTAFYDLYRLKDGAIAEHWNVVEVIAPCDAWKNENGKF